MTSTLYIIPGLTFILTLILFVLLIQSLVRYKGKRTLISKIEKDGRAEEKRKYSAKERAQLLMVKVTGNLGGLAKPKNENDISNLRRKLMQAGLSRYKNAVMVFFGSKILCMIVLPIIFLSLRLSLFKNMLILQLAFMIIVLAVAGFYLPDIWLRIRISKRKDEILRGFPDGLDLMVVCAEAGMGLDAAINRVGEEMKLRHPILSEELKMLTLELRAGKLRRDALRNLALRTDLEDVQSFATLLIQTERFGTSIAQAMRVQSDSMRTKRSLKVEELAAKLPVKLLFPTIFFIFPSLFLVLMGPALIRAFRVWKG